MVVRAELTFATSEGRKQLVRVPNPLPVVTAAILNTAVASFIAANPFDAAIGTLEALDRAQRVEVIRTDLI